MKKIDIDSHYFEPLDWLEQIAPDLAKEVPPLDAEEALAVGA